MPFLRRVALLLSRCCSVITSSDIKSQTSQTIFSYQGRPTMNLSEINGDVEKCQTGRVLKVGQRRDFPLKPVILNC